MSKYVDLLKSARPEHLYVLDADRTTLDGGTITDLGYGGVDATVLEVSGVSEVEVYPPLIQGVERSLHFNVNHDYGADTTTQYSALNVALAEQYFGPTGLDAWTIEMVVKPDSVTRGRYGTDLGATLIGINSTGVTGFDMVYDNTNPESLLVSFRLILDFDEEAGVELFSTEAVYDPDSVYHLALQRFENTYSLFVDGLPAAEGSHNNTYNLAAPSVDIKIGGWNSRYHSDATFQSVAFFPRQTTQPKDIQSRSGAVEVDSAYETIESLGPDYSIDAEQDGSVAVIEPTLSSISTGSEIADLYESPPGSLTLQSNQLGSGAVTASKKIKFDLSGLTAGIISYLDITSTTDANSSVTVNYSFDDVAYSTWTEGSDNISEIDANWGAAV